MDLTGTDDDDDDSPPAIPDLAAEKLRPAAKLRPSPKRRPAKKKVQAKLKFRSLTMPCRSNASLVVRSDLAEGMVVRTDSAEGKPAARKKCPAQEDPHSCALVPMPFAGSAPVLLGSDSVASPVAGEGSYWGSCCD